MPGPTILIIDDDKLVRWSLSALLGRAGFRVCEAATGAGGVAAVHLGRADLVLLDIALPDQDGFTVLKMIRQARPDLPVLMMTADATPETAERATRLGAQGHLGKPYDPTALQAAVRGALKQSAVQSGRSAA
ncbi:MAG TPA: response regulator [Candidatus Methylomirabilis sp.]|nr:response regulator [Candidatus Methylomirabilis sp.]